MSTPKKTFQTVSFKFISVIDPTQIITLRGHYQKATEIVPADVRKSAAVKAAELLDDAYVFTFKPGVVVTEKALEDWAGASQFIIYKEGVGSGIVISGATMNAGKTVLTLTFPENINKVGNAAALKAAITFSSNGTSYAALGGSDTVGTVDGTSNTFTITFNSALTTNTNYIKIAAGALVDVDLNTNVLLTSPVIDAALPTVTFLPASGATGVAVAANIVLTFSEKIFLGTTGAEIQNSDLAALLTLKLTNSSGADKAFTATIDATKKIITIDPTTNMTGAQLHYVAVAANAFRDATGNKNALASATFTTV